MKRLFFKQTELNNTCSGVLDTSAASGRAAERPPPQQGMRRERGAAGGLSKAVRRCAALLTAGCRKPGAHIASTSCWLEIAASPAAFRLSGLASLLCPLLCLLLLLDLATAQATPPAAAPTNCGSSSSRTHHHLECCAYIFRSPPMSLLRRALALEGHAAAGPLLLLCLLCRQYS